jgi:PAS domain S-box-containing protein
VNVAQPLIQAGLIGEAIDAGPVLVFVADENMNYVAANQHACSTLGYTREELLGLRVSDVAPDPRSAEEYTQMLDAGRSAGRAQLRHRDGRLLPFVYRAQQTSVAGMALYVAAGWIDEAA